MIATLLHWHDTMHHKRSYLVLAVLAALVHQPVQAACQFDHAVFRDAANGEDASVVALAQLRHTRRGVIFQFALAHASGYGRFYLTRTGTPDSRSYDVHYFDSRLIETSVDTGPPRWIPHISALSRSSCAHDRPSNALLQSDYPSAAPTIESPHRDAASIAHTTLSFGLWG